jgi:cytochrome P450
MRRLDKGVRGLCMTETLATQIEAVRTPAGGGGAMAFALRNAWLMRGLARVGAWLGTRLGRPLPIKKTVIVLRHADVVDVLKRDTDFLIAPTNHERIDLVNGPFVLGMDRGPRWSAEHRGLYEALAKVDLGALSRQAAADADQILADSNGSFDAVQDYSWIICGRTTQRMFGIKDMDLGLFLQTSRAIFYHVFLNVSKDSKVTERALIAGELMKNWLSSEIAKRRADLGSAPGNDFMGALMSDPSLDDDMIRRTLGGMLVGSIDTINGVTARVLKIMDAYPKLRARALEGMENPARLNHYCLEAHRLWPQTPGVARKAAGDTTIGNTHVKADSSMIVLTSAAMFDPEAFNKPMTVRPDRPASSYLHFGSGIHACAGRALSDLQVPMLVGKLLARNYRVDGSMKWAGPFPDRLPISFDRN